MDPRAPQKTRTYPNRYLPHGPPTPLMNRQIFHRVLLSADLRPVPANPSFQAVLFYVDRSEQLGVHFPHSMVFLSMN